MYCVVHDHYVCADLNGLYPLEQGLGNAGVLALRMLYSSVCHSKNPYGMFLTSMDPHLLRSIQPLDVLYFWQQAARVAEGTPWMAVFAVDEVCC